MARRDRYCAATKCRLLGKERKSLTQPQTDVDDPNATFCRITDKPCLSSASLGPTWVSPVRVMKGYHTICKKVPPRMGALILAKEFESPDEALRKI
jgi:hypothetical protein